MITPEQVVMKINEWNRCVGILLGVIHICYMLVANWKLSIINPTNSLYPPASSQCNQHLILLILRQHSTYDGYWESHMWIMSMRKLENMRKFTGVTGFFKRVKRSLRHHKSWHLWVPLACPSLHPGYVLRIMRISMVNSENTVPSWPGAHLPEMEHDRCWFAYGLRRGAAMIREQICR